MTAVVARNPELEAARRAAEAALAAGAQVLERLRQSAAGFFAVQLEGETVFTRRPPVSLTLPLGGTPPARLALVPQGRRNRWAKTTTLNTEFVCGELVVDYPCTESRCASRVELGLSLTPGQLWLTRCCARSGEAAARVVEVAEEFFADPASVFSRSEYCCCICGRALIDEVSRSRGIGPECHKRVDEYFHLRRPVVRLRSLPPLLVTEAPQLCAAGPLQQQELFAQEGR
jgi:hypothetical protein